MLLKRNSPVVETDSTLADAAAILRARGADTVAVVRDGRLFGLVLAEDLAAAHPSDATTLSVGEVNGALASIPVTAIMRRDVATVIPETPAAEVARLVRATGAPVAVVAREQQFLGLLGARELLVVLEAPPTWSSRTRSGVRPGWSPFLTPGTPMRDASLTAIRRSPPRASRPTRTSA